MFDVDVKGLDAIRKLRQANAENALRGVGNAIGLSAVNVARRVSPVDTGLLRGSINHKVSDTNDEVVIGSNVHYAPYQELGVPAGMRERKNKGRAFRTAFWHPGNKARKFLWGGIFPESRQREFERIIREHVDKFWAGVIG